MNTKRNLIAGTADGATYIHGYVNHEGAHAAVIDGFTRGLVALTGPADDAESRADARLFAAADKLAALVREAAAPGGIGMHEFARDGGWLDRAEQVLRSIEPEPVTGGFHA